MAPSFDPLGDSLGGLSVLGQAFAACVRGFEVWQKGKAIAEEVVIFQIKLEMQGAKFKAWGCDWGIERNAHVHHPRFKQFGNLAITYMNLILHQTNSLEALDSEFPVLATITQPLVSPASSFGRMSEIAGDQLRQALEAFRLRDTISSIDENATIQEKIKWGWQDGKAQKRLQILESLIFDLYQLFPPPVIDPASALVLNASFASEDRRTRKSIYDQVTDEGGDSLSSGVAWLKSTIAMMEARSFSLQDKDVRKRWRELSNIRHHDQRNSRAIGVFQGSDVLVEWKIVPVGRSRFENNVLDTRVKDIARLLRPDQKPDDLRTLSCRGIIEEEDKRQKRYGLLYSYPTPSTIYSLREVICQPEVPLMLGDYFTIAQVLSRALLFLHLAGWLHKCIRSDNILFFANGLHEINPTCPYLVGFECSRADERNALTEDFADDREFNLYRHPSSQGIPIDPIDEINPNEASELPVRSSYRRQYDIYSLGVILIELGLQKPAQAILDEASADPDFGRYSPEKFRAFLINKKIPMLGPKMGSLYRDAARLCISGDFDLTGRTLEVAFYLQVVKQLDRCNA